MLRTDFSWSDRLLGLAEKSEIPSYVYRALIQNGNIGMSSAAGFLKSVVGFVLVLLTNGIVKKINPDYALY